MGGGNIGWGGGVDAVLRRLLESFKSRQVGLAYSFAGVKGLLLVRFLNGEISREDFERESLAVDRLGHDTITSVAAQYVRDVRGVVSPGLAGQPVPVVPFRAAVSAAFIRLDADFIERLRGKREQSGRAGNDGRIVKITERRSASRFQQASRETVIVASESVASGWRVVTDGSPCAFCGMLASYGEDARHVEGWKDHQFHESCGCTIQEVPFGVDVEYTDRERKLIGLREQAERLADTPEGRKYGKTVQGRVLAIMRENGQNIVNDAHSFDAAKNRKSKHGKSRKKTPKRVSVLSSENNNLLRLIRDEGMRIERLEVRKLPHSLSDGQIIERVAGKDKTGGSCVSAAYAYVANNAGLNVLDYRGGDAKDFFAKFANPHSVLSEGWATGWVEHGVNGFKTSDAVMGHMEAGKQYLLCAGKHCAVVRKQDGGRTEYLELQNDHNNGWHTLTPVTLEYRFGVQANPSNEEPEIAKYSCLVDVHSLQESKKWRELLPYLNTAHVLQQKGARHEGQYAPEVD